MPKTFLFPLGSFLSGFILMSFEILSARIIAPLAGNSLYSWASVIGITLLGLSLGAISGGWLADKGAPRAYLVRATLFSSLALACVPSIAIAMRAMPSVGNIILTSLVFSFILFFPTSFLLGTIQPLLLKIYSSSFETLGKKYGLLSMLWSLGSILGVFLMGFVFISLFSVSTIVMTLSITCFLLGISFAFVDGKLSEKRGVGTLAASILAAIIILSFLFYQNKGFKQRGVVFEKDTPYYHLTIADFLMGDLGFARGFFLDYDTHSLESMITSPTAYTNIFPVFDIVAKKPKSALVIGAGAYTLPKHISSYYKIPVDVLELDPEIPAIAEKYFGVDENMVATTIGEARAFMRSTEKKYDLVFGDAYNSFINVPWHLTTIEYYQETKKHLTPGGVYAMSFIGAEKGEDSLFFKAMLKTFKEVYPTTYVFSFSFNKEDLGSFVFVGINDANNKALSGEFVREKLKTLNVYSFLRFFLRDSQEYDLADAPILTDDFAPTENYMKHIASRYFDGYKLFLTSILDQETSFRGEVRNNRLVFLAK